MKQQSRLAVLGAVFGALLLVGAGCSASIGSGAAAAPSLGDEVFVKPTDGDRWDKATIEAFSGDVYSVRDSFTDQVEEGVTLNRMAPLPSGAAIVKVGDRVVGAWVGDSFYGGTVTAVGTGAATIKWDDGSAPSETTFDQIVKPFE